MICELPFYGSFVSNRPILISIKEIGNGLYDLRARGIEYQIDIHPLFNPDKDFFGVKDIHNNFHKIIGTDDCFVRFECVNLALPALDNPD